jgi:hypothetical protein
MPDNYQAAALISGLHYTMGSSVATNHARHVKIVELAHNSREYQAKEHSITMHQHESLLQEPGQMDCPLLKAIGYPVIIVSTTPGQVCIPSWSRATHTTTGWPQQRHRVLKLV